MKTISLISLFLSALLFLTLSFSSAVSKQIDKEKKHNYQDHCSKINEYDSNEKCEMYVPDRPAGPKKPKCQKSSMGGCKT